MTPNQVHLLHKNQTLFGVLSVFRTAHATVIPGLTTSLKNQHLFNAVTGAGAVEMAIIVEYTQQLDHGWKWLMKSAKN